MTQTITPPKKQANRGRLADTNHVDTLISNYKKNRWRDNSNKIGKPDSLSVWYGLQELEDFLKLAKQNNADGIKMYFGEYPPDYEPTPEFQNRQTIVLVATRKSKSAQGIGNKEIYITCHGRKEILAFNTGQLCPPWCVPDIPPGEGDWTNRLETMKIGLTFLENNDGITII
jgi:hypothetical protein